MPYLMILFLLWSQPVLSDEHDNLKSSVNVQVKSAYSDKGKVVLSIFDSKETFLEQSIRTVHAKPNQNGIAKFIIEDLDHIEYSFSAFLDLDENGDLNTNFFGIPSEPVGFSNNAKSRFGPPGFEQTKFKPSDKPSIEIRLISIGD